MLARVGSFAESVLREDTRSRASQTEGAIELARSLAEPAPGPATLDELLDTLRAAAGVGFNQLHPGFLGYVPPVGLPIGAIADLVAAIQSRYVGLYAPSPALVQLEWNAWRWVADVFDFPARARGVFTSGGSMATLTAMVAARHAVLGSNSAQGCVYLTRETHHAVERAATVMGIDHAQLRHVPVTPGLTMDPAALDAMIEADAAAGARPFLVVANAGTINTGAVDPIARLVEVAHRRGLWVHADGAYGGFFMLTHRGRQALDGLQLVDSLVVDPHKGMFFAPGLGCVMVREGRHLAEAHAADAAYLADLDRDDEMLDLSAYSIELTRPMRGLRVWMALKLYGWEPFAAALDRDLDLAARLDAELRADGRLEMPWRPTLSTVTFRPAGSTDEGARVALDRVNHSGEVLLSSTTAPGPDGAQHAWIRACFMGHRATDGVVDAVVRGVRGALGDDAEAARL